MAKVFLNPGHHPGIDNGAVNSQYDVTEARIVLTIGELTKGYLEAAGCEVMMVQSDNLMVNHRLILQYVLQQIVGQPTYLYQSTAMQPRLRQPPALKLLFSVQAAKASRWQNASKIR